MGRMKERSMTELLAGTAHTASPNEQYLLDLCRKHKTADIHLARACELYNKAPADVTDEERRIAKNKNYALVYS